MIRRHPILAFAAALIMTMLLDGVVLCQKPSGSISGRIVSDDGQPLLNARITLIGSGGSSNNMQARAMIAPDEEGNFRVDGLDPRTYKIYAYAPGYVAVDQENFQSSTMMGVASVASYRIGDTVTLTMTRGAVITGRVLTAAGEPVVGINVRAMRVRDHAGRSGGAEPGIFSSSMKTDDRGVYRIYGLVSGSYVVSAGGGAFSALQTPFDARSPVYHPSSTRETAAELTVRNGEELSGIDIRYRSERGYSISGRVSGAPVAASRGPGGSFITVWLRRAATGESVSQTVISPNSSQNGYAFYGVPPGEYEVEAARSGVSDVAPMISEPRRVTITSADASGINLALINAPSIAGTFAIEKPGEGEKNSCHVTKEFTIEETQILAVGNETGEIDQNDRNVLISQSNAPSPDASGAFTIRGIRAAHYRILVSLPSDGLYLKSMTIDKSDRNPGRDGIILKQGERVTGLKITAARGAASLSGKVESDEVRSLHVHLVPQESESKDDVLRYYEVPLEGREYNFTNLAPGKYWVVFKAGGKVPLAWNPAERAALRKEAEAKGKAVELESCK